MTTTQALAKLHKEIVGTDGKNSVAKTLASLAANWSSTNVGAIPTLPSASGNYKLVVSVTSGVASYSWAKIT